MKVNNSYSDQSFGTLNFTPEARKLLADRIRKMPISSRRHESVKLYKNLIVSQRNNSNDIFISTVEDVSSGLKFLTAKFKHPRTGKDVYMDEHLFSNGIGLVEKACNTEKMMQVDKPIILQKMEQIVQNMVEYYENIYKS